MKIHIKNFLKVLKKFLRQTRGQKRLFLFYGIINMTITNLFLQLFLSKSYISTSTATLAAQIINMFLGYFTYSKLVFKSHNIFINKFFTKYLLLMTFIWLTNFYCIELLKFAGFARTISALTLVPLLAFASFIVQKYYIFKN